ncbi:MAG: autotransporter outer membrane beta-barrel domain-containing protein, partial [Maricaulis sp.]|nr:autotransporter outer membrane beta-barrel domain-containing protein [Maricaulis sp.]
AIDSLDEQCVWSRLEMTTRDRTSSFENFRVEAATTRFSGGFEQNIGNDWSVVGAINYEHVDQTDVDDQRSHTTGQGFSAGVGVEKNNANNHFYGASISGGWSWLDTERAVTIFERGVGVSAPETGYLRASVHVGNMWRHGQAFASPSFSLDLTNLHHAGLVEEGLEGIGVEVLEHDQFIAAINPEVTMGYVFNETQTSSLISSITMGMRISSQDRLELPIRFIGANPDAQAAEIGTVLDQVVYQLGADIQISGDDNLGLHFSYDGEFGEDTEHHRAGFDLRLRF